MLTALSDSLRLMQKLTASTRIMILIKPLMVLCLRTRLLILKLNSYTSMGISVMSSNLASLPTVLESSGISLFYNKNFIASHPDITVEKKSDSPDEDKSVHDSRLLIPTLKDFFLKHPLINPKTLLHRRQLFKQKVSVGWLPLYLKAGKLRDPPAFMMARSRCSVPIGSLSKRSGRLLAPIQHTVPTTKVCPLACLPPLTSSPAPTSSSISFRVHHKATPGCGYLLLLHKFPP